MRFGPKWSTRKVIDLARIWHSQKHGQVAYEYVFLRVHAVLPVIQHQMLLCYALLCRK